MKKLILIDAHAVIHRAWHALPPLTSPGGEPVAAVYGFASVLLKMIRELKPDYAVAAFDHEGPTFRHAVFERYKAQRVKAPDALYQQIPLVKELVKAFGIPMLEKAGYEADDIIGTVAARVGAKHADTEIIIVTGDLDTLQLIDERTKVLTMRTGVSDTVLYDVRAVRERYGLTPRQLIDFKGLRGDPSDNIPGVKGIGEKTAIELLKSHPSIEEVYRALKKRRLSAKPGVIAALKAHEADALFSKTLATIDRNVPISFVLASARLRKSAASREEVRAMLERFGFSSLLQRIGPSARLVEAPAKRAGRLPDGQGRAGQEPTSAAAAEAPGGGSAAVGPVRVKAVLKLADVSARAGAVLLYHPPEEAVFVAVSGEEVFRLPEAALADPHNASWFSAGRPVYGFGLKQLLRLGLSGYDPSLLRDLALIWYLLDPGRRTYDPATLLAREFRGQEVPTAPPDVAVRLFALAPTLEERLRREELAKVYDELDGPLVPILAAMEAQGIGFDAKPLRALAAGMGRELAKLESKISKAAGGPFNILSPRQLAAVLFERLGLLSTGIRRTEKTGALSTRESELVKLRDRHPIIADILRYREVAKLKSTYVDVLPKLVGPDGRIHTTWDQMGTATGRLASASPNLQNIPIRGEDGRKIRKAFVAGRGFQLVAFDYSQLELRIAADLAGDEKMIEAFSRGLDIHRLTAAEVNNIPFDRVTPELRYRAKALNFGILYGMGARAFAESAGVPRAEAELFIEEYFRDFRGIARFIEETKTFGRAHGFTKTAFGRKRYFPEFAGTGFRLQREAERMAVNHPIQGTEADIMRKAMIDIDRFLRDRGWRDDVRLLLQIHDELMFEIKTGRIASVVSEIRRLMEGAWEGKVPMKVEVKRGRNWGELA